MPWQRHTSGVLRRCRSLLEELVLVIAVIRFSLIFLLAVEKPSEEIVKSVAFHQHEREQYSHIALGYRLEGQVRRFPFPVRFP